MHEVLYILFVSYIQTTFGNVCMWIKLSRCRYYFSLTVLKSTELLCIFSPPLWLIEDRPWGAAHQLGPPGSLLPRRQVLPTQGDGEEALRPSAHPAAQTCSVRGRQTKRLWMDGWMDGYETKTRRDEDGAVKQKQITRSGSQLTKVLPGLVLSFHRIHLAQI